jgi:glycosyltransferase involved in cell wall biosynthesis
LVVSTYPPASLGGYELECASVVEHLARRHELLVLSTARRVNAARHPEAGARGFEVRRELALLTPDERGALRAPLASLRAAAAARSALQWQPDLVYAWNGASIPHTALRVLADSGTPLAFRVCEHWFSGLFWRDQFLRELLPGERHPSRSAWAGVCRAVNLLPMLRIDPTAPLQTAISWNSEAMRRMARVPPFIDPVLERTEHAVPPHGDLYAEVRRQRTTENDEIVFLGRIVPEKGLEVAIEALALLGSQEHIDAELLVAGPDEHGHGQALRALAGQLGVAQQVRWLGALEPDAIASMLARASAMIVPSTWDEPLGLVAIEGALARLPVVASDVGGIGEALHDEDHALLFPRGDASAAAAALARTLREVEPTAARVQRAFERAQAFRLGPYLAGQESFVTAAHEVLQSTRGPTRRATVERQLS